MSEMANSGLLGLDRKAMEAERLARLKKRTAGQAELLEPARPTKSVRVETSAKVVTRSKPTDAKSANSAAITQAAPLVVPQDSPSSIQYPKGALKRTWASRHLRNNDITFEEVLQPSSLTTAMISSWQFDFDWFLTKMNLSKTKLIFALEAKDRFGREYWRAQFAGLEKSVRLCFPPMMDYKYARMHAKLMLLFHPTHLRIVVPSANPMRHDWGEGGVMENSVFIIDLPRLQPDRDSHEAAERTPFQAELRLFLVAMELPDDVIEGTSKFDFGETRNLAFVHSIPGVHEGDKALMTGFLSLGKAVRTIKCAPQPDEQVEIDYATSSVGSLDSNQVNTFALSLRGTFPLEAGGRPLGATVSSFNQPSSASSKTKLRMVFPSDNTVKDSTGGKNSAGTIFMTRSAYENPKFPKHLLHDYESTRNGLLSHNKLILFRSPSTAYVYNGSANFSQSAWGRLAFPKPTKKQATAATHGSIKLSVTHWECGVLIPVVQHPSNEDENASKATENTGDVLPYSVFDEVLDLPFKCPPRKYAEGQIPWMQ